MKEYFPLFLYIAICIFNIVAAFVIVKFTRLNPEAGECHEMAMASLKLAFFLLLGMGFIFPLPGLGLLHVMEMGRSGGLLIFGFITLLLLGTLMGCVQLANRKEWL